MSNPVQYQVQRKDTSGDWWDVGAPVDSLAEAVKIESRAFPGEGLRIVRMEVVSGAPSEAEEIEATIRA